MRAAYHLAFAVFSLGTVATPATAPNATSNAGVRISANDDRALLDEVRSVDANLWRGTVPRQDFTFATHFSRGAAVGETLPEDVELHPIPRHETYRYAVMKSHRVIVDAASRRIIYVVR
jgi:hypothetical protein